MDWGAFVIVFVFLFMAFINGAGAYLLDMAVKSGQTYEAEQHGKIIVEQSFLYTAELDQASKNLLRNNIPGLESDQARELDGIKGRFQREAKEIARREGGSETDIANKLLASFNAHGTRDFISEEDATPGLTNLSTHGRMPAMLGSLVLLWWLIMLIFQGEGLELDLQRRRHPMWEWLFSHPVPTGAVFLAEMLAPLAANPMYWSAPLFPGILFGLAYGTPTGILAGLLIGVPVTVAAACVGKALEIGIMLRVSPRSRGVLSGLMNWLGYAAMMAMLLGKFLVDKVPGGVLKHLAILDGLPWPWLRLFLGNASDGEQSALIALVTCWIAVLIAFAASVSFSVWAMQRGLSGAFGAEVTKPAGPGGRAAQFGREPLYRKELLWFVRDRSAIVQSILIPLTVAAVQLFNFRFMLQHAQREWNYLCGAAIIFGTYFLWVLGPKSLASEGAALWISLTWPRGLESLLKAKAWLWALISTGMVAMVLAYAAVLFPASWWKLLLVGLGWFIFSRSMAEKSVTLVTVTSESGEVQTVRKGSRFAAQMGMFTFAIGVITQQWNLAIVGIVYSYMTAAAMWQNFRARLPYLFDPWSEELPKAPTMMHAMVSISVLLEVAAVLTGALIGLLGKDSAAIALAAAYALSAIGVSIGVSIFLTNRSVRPAEIWYWAGPRDTESEPQGTLLPGWLGSGPIDRTLPGALLMGAAGGVVLGLLAHGYTAILEHIPKIAEIIRKDQEEASKIPGWHTSYAIMAIGFAPLAEEYLFRGLLFRALDREWGGWRAVIGSAAFFAAYHPTLAWPPVFLVGVANALLFKKTKRLNAAVVLHMVYNAVVLLR
ncbi:MAG TPA: CPBP family intramembrane glutamic endopeptidase [Acidobacteriaceae bacterium]